MEGSSLLVSRAAKPWHGHTLEGFGGSGARFWTPAVLRGRVVTKPWQGRTFEGSGGSGALLDRVVTFSVEGRQGRTPECSAVAAMPMLLQLSEYQGVNDTVVAGRVVILNLSTVSAKQASSQAAKPGKGRGKQLSRGNRGNDGQARVALGGHRQPQQGSLRGGMAQAGLPSVAARGCGRSHYHYGSSSPPQYSTSRLLYQLRLKGTLGIQKSMNSCLGRRCRSCIRWCH